MGLCAGKDNLDFRHDIHMPSGGMNGSGLAAEPDPVSAAAPLPSPPSDWVAFAQRNHRQ